MKTIYDYLEKTQILEFRRKIKGRQLPIFDRFAKFSSKKLILKKNRAKKVILATDGLTAVCGEFDYPMMVASQAAVDIMEVAYNRWKQDWEFNVNGYQQANSRIPDWNRDDIAIVSWQTNASFPIPRLDSGQAILQNQPPTTKMLKLL